MAPFSTTISRTGTIPDQYDHAITLVDHTAPQAPAPDPDIDSDARASSSRDPSHSPSPKDSPGRVLGKKLTRNTLHDELAKRKYRKLREGRHEGAEDGGEGGVEESATPSDVAGPSETRDNGVAKVDTTDGLDFAPTQSQERGRLKGLAHRVTSKHERRKSSKQRKQTDHEVDILYENQRGWFLFGIPLYSQKSLLNLDPAAWVTREFKDSAVNITNAQLPDPSWEWAWKNWYVDMSYDVDEEGWQYSLGFSSKWAWHGTHPWFHNFVRRRRWLRKRVKTPTGKRGKDGSLQQGHMLNADYFTIHGTQTVSRDTSADRRTGRSSYQSRASTREQDDIVNTEEIKDISNLMKVLRHATVDREKIDVVKKFVDQGGEEVHYLEDQIPSIMSMFVYQTSRRQLLSFLLRTVNEARAHRKEHLKSGTPESETESRRIDNLLKAVKAADEQVRNLEFWSDVKGVEKGAKGEEKLRLSRGSDGGEGAVAQVEDITPQLKDGFDGADDENNKGAENIRGIPDEAEIEQADMKAILDSADPETKLGDVKELHELNTGGHDAENDESENKLDKGKGKEVASGPDNLIVQDDPVSEDEGAAD